MLADEFQNMLYSRKVRYGNEICYTADAILSTHRQYFTSVEYSMLASLHQTLPQHPCFERGLRHMSLNQPDFINMVRNTHLQ